MSFPVFRPGFGYNYTNISSPFSADRQTFAAMQPQHVTPEDRPQDSQADEYFHNQSQAPDMAGNSGDDWEAPTSYNVPVEQEGVTPYLDLLRLPLAQQVLDNPHAHMDSETYFRDAQGAADYRSSLGEQQAPDDTLPVTDSQKRACVKLMFMAFKSVAHAMDNDGMKRPFEEQRHNNKKVEAMCWDLLMAIIRRCENGPLLKAYDPNKAVSNPTINTFAERLDAVVGSLLLQKTICKHLFDAPYINTFVDDPKKACGRVNSNRELNKKKGDVMRKGKAVVDLEEPPKTPKRKRAKQNNSEYEYDDASSPAYGTYGSSIYSAMGSNPPSRRSVRSRSKKEQAMFAPESAGTFRTNSTGFGDLPFVKDENDIFATSFLPSPTFGGSLGVPVRSANGMGGSSFNLSAMTSPLRAVSERMNGGFRGFTANNVPQSPQQNGEMAGIEEGVDFSRYQHMLQPSSAVPQVDHARQAMGFAQAQTFSRLQNNGYGHHAMTYDYQSLNGRRGAISHPYQNGNGGFAAASMPSPQINADDDVEEEKIAPQ